MKNITWRKIALISTITLGVGTAFGVGYALGSLATAEFIVDRALELDLIQNVSRMELIEYYLKLKGGV